VRVAAGGMGRGGARDTLVCLFSVRARWAQPRAVNRANPQEGRASLVPRRALDAKGRSPRSLRPCSLTGGCRSPAPSRSSRRGEAAPLTSCSRFPDCLSCLGRRATSIGTLLHERETGTWTRNAVPSWVQACVGGPDVLYTAGWGLSLCLGLCTSQNEPFPPRNACRLYGRKPTATTLLTKL
jgi:hypothetical protein